MSTITNLQAMENNLITEFADRIAKARGPFEWERLRLEIDAAAIATADKEMLNGLVADRFRQEREVQKELAPA